MDMGLSGKVALITGSTRGIGLAIARGLAAEGCRVCINGRETDTMDAALHDLYKQGAEAIGIAGDMLERNDIDQVVDGVATHFGRLDIVVNNAGGSKGQTLQEASDTDFEEALQLNLMAAIRTSRFAIPHMKVQGGGRIINIASIWGKESGGRITYNVAKAALISLTKALARDLAADGILVNCIAPGSIFFPGGSWERRMNANPDAIGAMVKNELPLGRFGRPEEVANVAIFLASERASLMTGACVVVDGGQSHANC